MADLENQNDNNDLDYEYLNTDDAANFLDEYNDYMPSIINTESLNDNLNNMSFQVENHRPSSAELMHQISSELRNGSTFKITLESRGSFANPASRKCYRFIISPVPNIVQTAPADGEFDVGLPSTSTKQKPVSMDSPPAADDLEQTGSVGSSSGPTEVIVDNCAMPKFRCKIKLVDIVELTSVAVEPMSVSQLSVSSSFDSPPSVSSAQQVRPADEEVQQSSSDLTDPQRRHSDSMMFSLANVEHVLSRDPIDTSEFDQTIVQVEAGVHDSSMLQDTTEVCGGDGTEVVTASHDVAIPKRCSTWKRTKRFFRRLLCCA
ncbi:hypothetical protein QTP88_013735 [Uroleucon formosanum]